MQAYSKRIKWMRCDGQPI